MTKKIFLVIFSIYCIFSPLAFAEMTGREVMQKQKDLHKSTSEFEVQKMILVDKGGNKENRELRRWSKEVEPDVNRTLMGFISPTDIKGTALLTWQHKDQADDQWLYLPAQGKMQRIAEGGKKNYFMGTDFTYEDLQSEKLDDYTYNVMKEEPAAEAACYVIEALPASEIKKKETSYSKRILWVEKERFVTHKVEYYDKRGGLQKTQTNVEWENVLGTIWRPKKTLMDNTKNNHKTVCGSTSRTINQPIDDQTFTDRFILKGDHTQ